jgi:hypothetical protein
VKSLALLILAILASISAPAPAPAADRQVWHYLGEVKITSATGRPMPSQVILLEKTHDPEKNLITERAITVKPDGSADEHTVTMTVHDNDFTLVDGAHSVTGAGKLFGPAWAWTYFRATFKATNGVPIEDENFLADPSVGVARKKIIGPDGKVIMYMDVTLKAVTPTTFKILSTTLLKK